MDGANSQLGGRNHKIFFDRKRMTCELREPDLGPGIAGIVPLVGRYQAVQKKLWDRARVQLSLRGQAAELLPMKARNCISNIVLNAGDMNRREGKPPTRSRQQEILK